MENAVKGDLGGTPSQDIFLEILMQINFFKTSIIQPSGEFDSEILCTVYPKARSNTVIGCCKLIPMYKQDLINMFDVFVDKEARRMGIGTFLINEVINYCKDYFHLRHLVLRVDKINNSAISFYKTCGFKIYKNSKKFLLMKVDL
jgi:ribosomal protein S18 acetylase RimI-like enzyme